MLGLTPRNIMAHHVTWHVARNNQKFGPYNWVQLQQLARPGRIQATDYVLCSAASRWQPAGSLQGLFADIKPQIHRRRLWPKLVGIAALLLLGAGGVFAGLKLADVFDAPAPAAKTADKDTDAR